MNRKERLVTLILFSLTITSFAVAGYYFLKARNVYDIYNYYLNANNNNPWPHNPPDWSYFYGFIEAWQTIGFSLTLIGITLLLIALVYFTHKKTSPVAAGGGYYGVQHRRSTGGGYLLLDQDRPL